uniref:Uncharacterized protein n=1 Tax=Anguilla anguilla TaxID=7936 RepID=A0A0E9TWL3_ANGAN
MCELAAFCITVSIPDKKKNKEGLRLIY